MGIWRGCGRCMGVAAVLFSELYGSYFHVVAAVLAEAVRRPLTGSRLEEIVREKAFVESVLTIPAALRSDWPLLKADGTTPLRHEPTMPLTLLQKRWLKTLLQDPRIQLFTPCTEGLADIEPLFQLADLVRFDQYLDGDPYGEAAYVAVFRQMLTALKENRSARLRYTGRKGRLHNSVCLPLRLEYSEKDDKFRLLASGRRNSYSINVARIQSCTLLGPAAPELYRAPVRHLESLTFRLWDERNALERVLLHFSHLEKETVRLEGQVYQVTLRYEREDETELLIRILSFGPMIQVVAPERFIALIRERLERQALGPG